MDDGQKTPGGHPDFNSYVKIQCVFIVNGQTNRQRHVARLEKLFSSCAVVSGFCSGGK
jgi:hypothetical protein